MPVKLTAALMGVLISAAISAQEMPAPIAALEDRGAVVGETFDAPGGLTGYTLRFQGQILTAYLTADASHVLVGNLFSGDGSNLSRPILNAAANAPRPEQEWEALSNGAWIADGDDQAARVVYALTDPNCPFCHRFYEQTRDWIDAGAVQIRHVMVGVLREDSLAKSATLLLAKDPAAAMAEHEDAFDEGGVTPLERLPSSAQEKVQANNSLMSQLGIRGTPAVFYRDDEDNIQLARGLPRGEALEAVMGGPRPE